MKMNYKGKWLTVTTVGAHRVHTVDAVGNRRAFTKKELSPAYKKKFYPTPVEVADRVFPIVPVNSVEINYSPPALKTYKVVLEINGLHGPKFADLGQKFANKNEASSWVTAQLNREGAFISIGNVGFSKEDLICFSIYEPK